MKVNFETEPHYVGWAKDTWSRTIKNAVIYDMKTGEILFKLEENKKEN